MPACDVNAAFSAPDRSQHRGEAVVAVDEDLNLVPAARGEADDGAAPLEDRRQSPTSQPTAVVPLEH